MTFDELKLLRLSNQHLLIPADAHTVVRDLCGLQAQYLSNAFHALRVRSNDFAPENISGMVKSWTLRGTMHLFVQSDLPVMLHQGRSHFLRPCDTFAEDACITAERKRFFAGLIAQSAAEGCGGRDALRQLCRDAGMTEVEEQSAFDPWGGLIRAMCEAGMLIHEVSEKKAYARCPDFVPMDREKAELELAGRYFLHYGPASIRDAAYFFAAPQSKVKEWIAKLPLRRLECGGNTYYCMEVPDNISEGMPECLFLAGFDPLMLGYEKTENPFLPAHLKRAVFSAGGHVAPTVLLNGRVCGKWKKKGRRLDVTLLEPCDARGQQLITEAAMRLWPQSGGVRLLTP